MDKINVLVTVPFPQPLIDKLADVSPVYEITRREAQTPEDLADIIGEADVLYAGPVIPVPETAPRLRWVQCHFAGIDNILNEPLYTQSEVMFTTTSGIHAVQMSEYVMMQVLAFAHRLPRMVEDQAKADWHRPRWDRYVPEELRDSTIGIVGYGSIGREIARLAQAFGMRVLVIKRDVRQIENKHYALPGTGDPLAEIPDRIYPKEALRSFLGGCDYVVLTVPLTGGTHHLIDAKALSAMRKNAVLINVARGDVVDEQALADALTREKIGGAALDVFSQEPLPPDSPLWALPNTIISPHVSGFSIHYDERATDVFAENLRRFASGEPLINLVDRAIDY
jgi:phosphoglycerate dehydrogenase-like enzyme